MIRIPRFDGGTQPSVYDIALKELMRDEGFKANPYFDPIGKVWTSGYGFTDPKHQHKWTEQEAREVLKQYIADKDKYARSNAAWGLSYQSMSPQMLAEIINLMFQGGDAVIDNRMPKFRKALINRNWNEATKLLDFGMSQTKSRSKRRLTNFGNGIAMMNLEKPTLPIADINNIPTVEQVVEQAPSRLYNISQPVLKIIQTEPVLFLNSIDVPYETPSPIHMRNNLLPDLRTLLEQQIFQPIINNQNKYDSGKNQYTIKKGDWLSKIAKQYTGDPMKYSELQSINNIENPDLIKPGQKIILPDSWFGQQPDSRNYNMTYNPDTNKWIAVSKDGLNAYNIDRNAVDSNEVDINIPEITVTGNRRYNIPQPTIDYSEHPSSLVINNNLSENDLNNGNKPPIDVNSSIWQDIANYAYDMSNKYLGNEITGGISTMLNGDIEGVAQLLRNFYARKINQQDDVLTQKLAQPVINKKQAVQTKDVLDEKLSKSSTEGSDTLWWKNDGGVVDYTGNKYYLRRSIPITDDMSFGVRNRGEYKDLPSDDAFITTYDSDGSNPNFLTYDDVIKSGLHKGTNWSGNPLLFIGVTKDGKLRIGDISLFGKGSRMKAVQYNDVDDIPRDKNGNLKWVVSGGDSRRFSPVLKEKDGKQTVGALMTAKNTKSGEHYNNIAGGSYILRCGDETRFVLGSIDDIVKAHELMRKNHKGKTVRWYSVDNGSYNRGLRTINGNITSQDLLDYDHQHPEGLGSGGGFIYLKK